MSLAPVKLARRVASEAQWLAGLVRRIVLMSEAIDKAAETIEKQTAEITTLKEDVRALRAQNELQTARLESIAIRAAADVTGDLSRRIGFLEGRASRDK